MSYLGAMDLDCGDWLAALGISEADVPRAVVIEGSWWREQRTGWRTGLLDDVRELEFPDMFWGRWHGQPVVYSCVYGAPRAVELAHVFGALGTRLLVTIGTCGALDEDLSPGDVVVPTRVIPKEGIAALYGSPDLVQGDRATAERARRHLADRDVVAHDGLHLTWHSIIAQSAQMVEAWKQSGYSSVDMETATAFAVARHFEVPAVAMLVVWDLLDRGTSFLDPLPAEDQRQLDLANAAVFDVALALVDESI